MSTTPSTCLTNALGSKNEMPCSPATYPIRGARANRVHQSRMVPEIAGGREILKSLQSAEFATPSSSSAEPAAAAAAALPTLRAAMGPPATPRQPQ